MYSHSSQSSESETTTERVRNNISKGMKTKNNSALLDVHVLPQRCLQIVNEQIELSDIIN